MQRAARAPRGEAGGPTADRRPAREGLPGNPGAAPGRAGGARDPWPGRSCAGDARRVHVAKIKTQPPPPPQSPFPSFWGSPSRPPRPAPKFQSYWCGWGTCRWVIWPPLQAPGGVSRISCVGALLGVRSFGVRGGFAGPRDGVRGDWRLAGASLAARPFLLCAPWPRSAGSWRDRSAGRRTAAANGPPVRAAAATLTRGSGACGPARGEGGRKRGRGLGRGISGRGIGPRTPRPTRIPSSDQVRAGASGDSSSACGAPLNVGPRGPPTTAASDPLLPSAGLRALPGLPFFPDFLLKSDRLGHL